mmetsp:Transcript_23592/g.32273  ORF Transcript_23592/g.32273 Transcript_23592/m.32273 type:complete len:395 (+) Transcript_23592:42-1226(+)
MASSILKSVPKAANKFARTNNVSAAAVNAFMTKCHVVNSPQSRSISGLSSKKMRAAYISKHNTPLEIVELPIPTPASNQILIQIKTSGCCHTDLHAMEGDWPVLSKLPLCPGHEGCGCIVAVGSDVKNFKVGDRVGVPWLHSACGVCEHCMTGWETLCTKQHMTGYSVDGGHREYSLADGNYAIKLPDKLSYEQAAPLMCAGVTSYKGIKETDTKAGDFLCVIGAAGGLGHLAVQYGKAMGRRVIAVDMGKERMEYCKSLGAEFTVDVSDTSSGKTPAEIVEAYTDGGAQGVLCLATHPSAFKSAVSMSRRKGTAVFVGLPKGGFDCSIFEIVLKRISLRGSIVGTRQDMQEALEFAERGMVKCSVELAKLEDVNDVYARMKRNEINGRVVLQF